MLKFTPEPSFLLFFQGESKVNFVRTIQISHFHKIAPSSGSSFEPRYTQLPFLLNLPLLFVWIGYSFSGGSNIVICLIFLIIYFISQQYNIFGLLQNDLDGEETVSETVSKAAINKI